MANLGIKYWQYRGSFNIKMNPNNTVISTLASAFIAYAVVEIPINFWYGVISGVIGIAGWVLYDYLP